MKATSLTPPLVETIRSSNREAVTETLDIIAQEYPNLQRERDAHLALHKQVQEFDPKVASLNMAPALERMEQSIDDAIAARPDSSDLRVREALKQAYEYMDYRTSQQSGLVSTDEMLENTRVLKALAKVTLLWAHLQKAEAEVIASRNPVLAIEEYRAARAHIQDLIGPENSLFHTISQALAEIMQ